MPENGPYDPDRHLTDEPAGEAVARIAQERRDRFAGPLPDTSDNADADAPDIPFENAAEPGSRDARIAAEISDAENVVEDLASQLGTLSEEAADAEAFGHGGLYEAVQCHLVAAAKDLRRAFEVLQNGDPEDHSAWRP